MGVRKPFCAWVQHTNHSSTEPPLLLGFAVIGFFKFLDILILDTWYVHINAIMLLVERQEGHPACKNWVVGAGIVTCPEQGADEV